MQIIETNRLKFLPLTLEMMQAANQNEGYARLGELLGVTVPQAWPGEDFRDALPVFIASAQKAPELPMWNGLVILKSTRTVIGDMGFMDGPDTDGRTEIGYSILPDYRRRGYASEMVKTLVQWALARPDISAVTARILPDNVSSQKVIMKAGLKHVGDDDEYMIWELRITDSLLHR